jgi:hypothetical protein
MPCKKNLAIYYDFFMEYNTHPFDVVVAFQGALALGGVPFSSMWRAHAGSCMHSA